MATNYTLDSVSEYSQCKQFLIYVLPKRLILALLLNINKIFAKQETELDIPQYSTMYNRYNHSAVSVGNNIFSKVIMKLQDDGGDLYFRIRTIMMVLCTC
jgi:hypothetical protein